MSPLARSLHRSGYSVKNWGYPSVRRSIRQHAQSLRHLLDSFDNPTISRIHLVTHSMGGIVARCAMNGGQLPKIGRIVMLAPPNAGSQVARWLAPCLGRICRPLNELSDRPDSFVNRLGFSSGVDVGVISAANDAVVTLRSTQLTGQRDHIVLPGRHGTLPLRGDTARQVCSFLAFGRFEHSACSDIVGEFSNDRPANRTATISTNAPSD
jgi:pimeloyl-ACP methyl ester carboxylesterase